MKAMRRLLQSSPGKCTNRPTCIVVLQRQYDIAPRRKLEPELQAQTLAGQTRNSDDAKRLVCEVSFAVELHPAHGTYKTKGILNPAFSEPGHSLIQIFLNMLASEGMLCRRARCSTFRKRSDI